MQPRAIGSIQEGSGTFKMGKENGCTLERSIKEDGESAGSARSNQEHKEYIRNIKIDQERWGAKSSGPSKRTWSQLV